MKALNTGVACPKSLGIFHAGQVSGFVAAFSVIASPMLNHVGG